MKWKVNGDCLDCVSKGVNLDFTAVVDGGCGWIGENDVLWDVCGGGGVVVEVFSMVAQGWCRSARVGLVVLIMECTVVVMMQYNGWVVVEDVVDLPVFVVLWIGGLASNSSSIEKGFVVRIFLVVSMPVRSQEVYVQFPTA